MTHKIFVTNGREYYIQYHLILEKDQEILKRYLNCQVVANFHLLISQIQYHHRHTESDDAHDCFVVLFQCRNYFTGARIFR